MQSKHDHGILDAWRGVLDRHPTPPGVETIFWDFSPPQVPKRVAERASKLPYAVIPDR